MELLPPARVAVCIAALPVLLQAAAPARLAIYYGYPSLVEGAGGSTARAAATFARYDDVVFGDGLELGESSPDPGLRVEQQRLADIVRRLHATARPPRLYGYVDLGRTQQLADAEIVRRVEAWRQLGVDGIFFDEAGRDFGVTASRRTAAVRAVHDRGLSAFMNAFDVDDLFDGAAARRGAASSPGALGRRDAVLVESFAVRNGVVQPRDAVAARVASAMKWRERTGVKVYAVTTGAGAFDTSAFAYAERLAAELQVDGFGWGEPNFSADTKLPWRFAP